MVIVKDLSRLGRDHVLTGYYIETFFPENRVRFISIMENYDSYKNYYSKQNSYKIRDVILSGNIVKFISSDGSRVTNFPGMNENPVCRVRSYAQNAADTYPLPVRDKFTGLSEYTKHCF